MISQVAVEVCKGWKEAIESSSPKLQLHARRVMEWKETLGKSWETLLPVQTSFRDMTSNNLALRLSVHLLIHTCQHSYPTPKQTSLCLFLRPWV